jgi:MoaA/NifB/PqqE/SkfB family radical SAM enzyme
MPIELIRKVLEECKGRGLREIIPSTMGEPLLFEHFDEIVDLCENHGVKLNLTTNGTFPGRGARAWAERIVPVASDVKISWNGAVSETQEKIMRGVRWERHLENVREFIAVRDWHAKEGGNRARVTFQMTFLEWNVGELADLVRLAVRLGVDRLKGHHVWTHFDELKDLSMRRDSAAILRWNESVKTAFRAAEEERFSDGRRLLLENIHPLDETSAGDLAPGGPCPFLGREAWVNTEGRFDPCCAPDTLRRTLGDFGNLHRKTIGEIWEGEEYRRLVNTYRTRHLCIGCNMRRPVEAL